MKHEHRERTSIFKTNITNLISELAGHPLDQLSAQEISLAAQTVTAYIKARSDDQPRFNNITLLVRIYLSRSVVKLAAAFSLALRLIMLHLMTLLGSTQSRICSIPFRNVASPPELMMHSFNQEPNRHDLFNYEQHGTRPQRIAHVICSRRHTSNPLEVEVALLGNGQARVLSAKVLSHPEAEQRRRISLSRLLSKTMLHRKNNLLNGLKSFNAISWRLIVCIRDKSTENFQAVLICAMMTAISPLSKVYHLQALCNAFSLACPGQARCDIYCDR